VKRLLQYRLIVVIGTIFPSALSLFAQSKSSDCTLQSASADCVAGNSSVATLPTPATDSALGSSRVTYVGGQLTIAAENASLREILRAVSLRTGAVIEFPAQRAGERIFTKVGPGSIKAVLTDFLNGSHFNYVMMGDPTDPNSLQRLILSDLDEPTAGSPAVNIAHEDAPPEPAKTFSPFSPPAQADAAAALPPVIIPDVQAPKEPLSGEALGSMMRELAHQQRQRQQDQDQATSQAPR
jgi:hypothetical protein